MFVVVQSPSCARLFCDPVDCSPPGSASMGSSRTSTGVGCRFLLQGVSLTQGANVSLLHWQTSFRTEPPGNPKMHLGGRYGSVSEVHIACFKPAVGTPALPGLRWSGTLHLSRTPCPPARRPTCFPEVRTFALIGTLSAPRAQL